MTYIFFNISSVLVCHQFTADTLNNGKSFYAEVMCKYQ